MEARSSIAIIAGTLLVCMALVAVMNTETNPASLSDTASTELSNDQGGTSTNGRVDLSIVGCAGFNCQRRYICIDKWKRCTDNWCTVNCNHKASFCPPTYCRGTPAAPAPTRAPTEKLTAAPTDAPTERPTAAPSDMPTELPTHSVTHAVSHSPTTALTEAPSEAPSEAPTEAPSEAPTDEPLPIPQTVVPLPSCIWTTVLMPKSKCAVTTGDHGITKEECQAKADAKKDAFYSWKKIDEKSETVTDQCFTSATCVGALSSTTNGWEVSYCTPADVANDKMCVTTSRGLACCSASCGTCSEDQCADAPGGKDACCPKIISQADKNCVTNTPPCLFTDGGFPTTDHDYKAMAKKVRFPTSLPDEDEKEQYEIDKAAGRGSASELATKSYLGQVRFAANKKRTEACCVEKSISTSDCAKKPNKFFKQCK